MTMPTPEEWSKMTADEKDRALRESTDRLREVNPELAAESDAARTAYRANWVANFQRAEALLREDGHDDIADMIALEWMRYDIQTGDPDFFDRPKEK